MEILGIEGQCAMGFADWETQYRTLLCLKKAENRETWLLEERDGVGRCVLKKAFDGQEKFLRAEYEVLRTLEENSGQKDKELPIFRENQGVGFLLREYVQGQTLEEMTEREGSCSLEEAARLGRMLCRKAAALHAQQPPVIHRDIKPENIVLTGMGRLRLIDFGTARQYKPEQEADTVCMGTRGYAAPEQFGFGQTDERTDIFAIGKVLLYIAAAGSGEEELSQLRGRQGRSFKRIIRRCCAYEPGRRYQNAEELEHALDKFIGSCGKRIWRERLLLGLLVVMSVLSLGLGIENLNLREEREEFSLTEINPGGEEIEKNSWNPYEFQTDVNQILEMLQKEEYGEMARACETLVEELSQNTVIAHVEPVSYWELQGEELGAYHTSRMGYEYVADRLSYGENLAWRSLGSFESCGEQIASAIRTCLEYTWVSQDGSEGRNVLAVYWLDGDDRNMDGCLIDLVDCISRGLEAGGLR